MLLSLLSDFFINLNKSCNHSSFDLLHYFLLNQHVLPAFSFYLTKLFLMPQRLTEQPNHSENLNLLLTTNCILKKFFFEDLI